MHVALNEKVFFLQVPRVRASTGNGLLFAWRGSQSLASGQPQSSQTTFAAFHCRAAGWSRWEGNQTSDRRQRTPPFKEALRPSQTSSTPRHSARLYLLLSMLQGFFFVSPPPKLQRSNSRSAHVCRCSRTWIQTTCRVALPVAVSTPSFQKPRPNQENWTNDQRWNVMTGSKDRAIKDLLPGFFFFFNKSVL